MESNRYELYRLRQKTVAIIFPADFTVFTFFGAGLSDEVHCFDCCFISSVKYQVHKYEMTIWEADGTPMQCEVRRFNIIRHFIVPSSAKRAKWFDWKVFA